MPINAGLFLLSPALTSETSFAGAMQTSAPSLSWLHITRGQHADSMGSETEVILGGGIAVTPLQFERTAEQIWSRLHRELTDQAASNNL